MVLDMNQRRLAVGLVVAFIYPDALKDEAIVQVTGDSVPLCFRPETKEANDGR